MLIPCWIKGLRKRNECVLYVPVGIWEILLGLAFVHSFICVISTNRAWCLYMYACDINAQCILLHVSVLLYAWGCYIRWCRGDESVLVAMAAIHPLYILFFRCLFCGRLVVKRCRYLITALWTKSVIFRILGFSNNWIFTCLTLSVHIYNVVDVHWNRWNCGWVLKNFCQQFLQTS